MQITHRTSCLHYPPNSEAIIHTQNCTTGEPLALLANCLSHGLAQSSKRISTLGPSSKIFEGMDAARKKGSGGIDKTRNGCDSPMSSSSGERRRSSVGFDSHSSPSSSPLGWPIKKAGQRKSLLASAAAAAAGYGYGGDEENGSKLYKLNSRNSEADLMKERFAKLLLGEDMSGSGKGVCTALAISNAITNLCATVFGQLWRLEPLPSQKKSLWRREIESLLSVGDHIVELIPTWQTYADGSKHEVMTCRPRSDLFINLPALRKLDNMLLQVLDSFVDTEFWYVDQGIVASDAADSSDSFRRTIQREEEKWWLPVPRVPAGGLSDNSRKQLNHTRESTSQILKAAMAINSVVLAEMDVPDSYLETLPKNGRACLGDLLYRHITSDQYSADCLLDCLNISSEHVALDIANRIESASYVWKRRAHPKPSTTTQSRGSTKSSWEMVKELMMDGDKMEMLAERAESLLLSLKQRFPNLTQTTLDTTKIQFNKDVGKSILESYARVLESLAFNIVARIDDLLYVDDLTKCSSSMIGHKKVSYPFTIGTPYRTTFSTPSRSPVPLVSPSPARGERTPFVNTTNTIVNRHNHRRGFGVKKALTNYLGADPKSKVCGNATDDAEQGRPLETNQNESKPQ